MNLIYLFEDKEIELSKPHQQMYQYMYHMSKEKIINLWRENTGLRQYNKIMYIYNRLQMVALDPKSVDYTFYGKIIQGSQKESVKNLTENLVNSNFQKQVAEKS